MSEIIIPAIVFSLAGAFYINKYNSLYREKNRLAEKADYLEDKCKYYALASMKWCRLYLEVKNNVSINKVNKDFNEGC